jgi:hypothetical protein
MKTWRTRLQRRATKHGLSIVHYEAIHPKKRVWLWMYGLHDGCFLNGGGGPYETLAAVKDRLDYLDSLAVEVTE